ncbi:rab proteins geranylgeranyltransferase component A 2-like [Elysia marginata]|uniref:Rab proteins geranylgeranyltransferase component A 2-like n=1 Tax=Elysia marginata TaxID=1093978 RepID=A0AAV4J7P3_9GAST|nr:rab proteins geranylgeranyltransferase component A 2-like [Elysia marginata]
MTDEDLPNEFDIVILGTGMTTTITAAAFSRIGLKVLHLDRNDYYGNLFANFNLDAIEKWKGKNQGLNKRESENVERKDMEALPDDVKAVNLPRETAQAFNLSSSFHVRNRTPKEEETAKKLRSVPFFLQPKPVPDSATVSEKSSDSLDTTPEKESNVNDKPQENMKDSANLTDQVNSGIQNIQLEKNQGEAANDESEVKETAQPSVEENVIATEEDKSSDKEDKQPSSAVQAKTDTEVTGNLAEESKEPENNAVGPAEEKKKDWTVEDIKDEWRRFCLDISPKVLFCCGEIIELLIRSDVARYCEFRTVSRVLTLLKNKLELVPCSRADVFGSKIVSLIEKRLMMKFLQFAADFENHAEEYEGELSQAFARMSAVFGGVYCLMETATHLLADADNNCCGIITSKGQRINCKYLVAEASYLPPTYTKRLSSGKISRGVYITDASISPSSDEDLTLLNFICQKDSSRAVTVMEMPPSACVCPKDLFVVYLTRVSDSDDPEEDLREVRERLFASQDCASSEDLSQPRILWSMHFTLNDWSEVELSDAAVKNVLVASEGGDAEIDLDKCVPEAKRLFQQVCPDEEFLPTPPNPEDIIHVDDTESPVATGSNSEFEQGVEGSEEKKEGDSDPGEPCDQSDESKEEKGQETRGDSANGDNSAASMNKEEQMTMDSSECKENES